MEKWGPGSILSLTGLAICYFSLLSNEHLGKIIIIIIIIIIIVNDSYKALFSNQS